MGAITVDMVKRRLRVIHGGDDDLIAELIDGATQEALRYMNRSQLPTLPHDFPDSDNYSEDVPSSEDPVARDVVDGCMLIIRGAYDAMTPGEIEGMRRAAEMKWAPYRVGLGV